MQLVLLHRHPSPDFVRACGLGIQHPIVLVSLSRSDAIKSLTTSPIAVSIRLQARKHTSSVSL